MHQQGVIGFKLKELKGQKEEDHKMWIEVVRKDIIPSIYENALIILQECTLNLASQMLVSLRMHYGPHVFS